MNMVKRAFRKINNWLKTPGKNFGTGMPIHRTLPTPEFSSTENSHRPISGEMKKRSHNRMRDRMQRASRKRNRS